MRTESISNRPPGKASKLSEDRIRAMWLSCLARQALIAEAELTPKPGLVDRRGAGAHSDLSLGIMRRSAFVIEPHLYRMACISIDFHPSQALRESIAAIGREAERAMFEATRWSNSHKGAIWTLGLLISAAAMRREDLISASTIAATAAEIASFNDFPAPRLVTHGDVVAKVYGVTGARGEARLGFPHVVDVGLPMLWKRRAAGAPERIARLDALLSIMSRLDDTCLLYRGGMEALEVSKHGALAVMRQGGSGTKVGMQGLQRLHRQLMALKVSPGGSADLLAATLFVDAIEHRRSEVHCDQDFPESTHGAD